MSEADIVIKISVNTKSLQKQLRRISLRLRFAIFMIKVAQWIGRSKLKVEIETEQEK